MALVCAASANISLAQDAKCVTRQVGNNSPQALRDVTRRLAWALE
jgi:hypothetical protein